ncbi:MAG: hypothetical protein PHN63_05140, partial [Candidatus Omnitrophica bacterium]|nr:hypothetical protein [Candidatus Omnitrophota bacterium]
IKEISPYIYGQIAYHETFPTHFRGLLAFVPGLGLIVTAFEALRREFAFAFKGLYESGTINPRGVFVTEFGKIPAVPQDLMPAENIASGVPSKILAALKDIRNRVNTADIDPADNVHRVFEQEETLLNGVDEWLAQNAADAQNIAGYDAIFRESTEIRRRMTEVCSPVVRFVLSADAIEGRDHFEEVEDIYLTGNFNHWNPMNPAYKMTRVEDENGVRFEIAIPLRAGVYEYKFYIPSMPKWAKNGWFSSKKDVFNPERAGVNDNYRRVVRKAGATRFAYKPMGKAAEDAKQAIDSEDIKDVYVACNLNGWKMDPEWRMRKEKGGMFTLDKMIPSDNATVIYKLVVVLTTGEVVWVGYYKDGQMERNGKGVEQEIGPSPSFNNVPANYVRYVSTQSIVKDLSSFSYPEAAEAFNDIVYKYKLVALPDGILARIPQLEQSSKKGKDGGAIIDDVPLWYDPTKGFVRVARYTAAIEFERGKRLGKEREIKPVLVEYSAKNNPLHDIHNKQPNKVILALKAAGVPMLLITNAFRIFTNHFQVTLVENRRQSLSESGLIKAATAIYLQVRDKFSMFFNSYGANASLNKAHTQFVGNRPFAIDDSTILTQGLRQYADFSVGRIGNYAKTGFAIEVRRDSPEVWGKVLNEVTARFTDYLARRNIPYNVVVRGTRVYIMPRTPIDKGFFGESFAAVEFMGHIVFTATELAMTRWFIKEAFKKEKLPILNSGRPEEVKSLLVSLFGEAKYDEIMSAAPQDREAILDRDLEKKIAEAYGLKKDRDEMALRTLKDISQTYYNNLNPQRDEGEINRLLSGSLNSLKEEEIDIALQNSNLSEGEMGQLDSELNGIVNVATEERAAEAPVTMGANVIMSLLLLGGLRGILSGTFAGDVASKTAMTASMGDMWSLYVILAVMIAVKLGMWIYDTYVRGEEPVKLLPKKLLIGVTSEEAKYHAWQQVGRSGLGDIVEDVIVIYRPDIKDFSDTASVRGLTGIFIDETIDLASISSEKFAQDISAIKLTEDHGIVFTMNNIDPNIRAEIAALIKKILGKDIKNMDAARIFKLALEAVKKADKDDIALLRYWIGEQRKQLVATAAYNDVVSSAAIIPAKDAASVTTEKVAINEPRLAENLNRTHRETPNVKNVFVYGGIFKTPEQARESLRQAGCNEDTLKDILFIEKRGKDFGSIADEIYQKTGIRNIGLRQTKGEFENIDPWRGIKVLEVQEMDINGRSVLLTMHTYEAILRILNSEGSNEAIAKALEGVLPGIAYDSSLKAFKYLPRTLPINYGEEIDAYRNAMLVLSAAA